MYKLITLTLAVLLSVAANAQTSFGTQDTSKDSYTKGKLRLDNPIYNTSDDDEALTIKDGKVIRKKVWLKSDADVQLKSNISQSASDNSSTTYPSSAVLHGVLPTKEDVANKSTDLVAPNNTKYPTTLIMANELNAKASIDAVNGLTDSVNKKPDTSVTTALQRSKIDTSYTDTVDLKISNAIDSSKVYANNLFLLSGSTGFKGIAYPATNPGTHVSGRLWQGSVSTVSQIFTNFGYTIPAYKQAYFYDNGVTYDTTTIPLDQLVIAQINAQNLINQATFEPVQLPVVGIVKSRFNQTNLASCTTNYGTSLTRLIDSSFAYNGTATEVVIQSTRTGPGVLKSFSKNGDGTFNTEGLLTVNLTTGTNVIDSTTLAGMPIKKGGTFGWYGAATGGGGVGIGTGSMATKTLAGNVSGNNLTFGATGTAQTWGIKVTYRVAATVVADSTVFPYGHSNPPVYTNQFTYTGTADSLTNQMSAGTIVSNFLVNSAGNIQAAANWKYISIPVSSYNEKMYVSKLYIRPATPVGSGYWNYTSSLGGAVLAFGSYNYGTDSGFVIPAGAKFFNIDIQDPSTTSTAYATTIISPRASLINKWSGIPFSSSSGGGGTQSNQSLNTYDNVLFNSATVKGLYVPDLPIGNGVAPADLEVGRMWKDWDGVSPSSYLRVKESN